MTCKWCEGDCKDMGDHCRKAKIAKYYKEHEKRITWGEEYTAPDESFGTWIEIKMVPDKSKSGVWHETWDFNKNLSEKDRNEITKILNNTITILTDEDYDYSTPYIIQIDDAGKCHLISACVRGKQELMDRILRVGKREWVNVG
ncbi:MAG: hypothetical protein PHT77_10195 [Bacteroidales bacterium]|nr:hypothetical protein [Bacteroidales bacterium]